MPDKTMAEFIEELRKEANNMMAMRDALVDVYNTLEKLQPFALHINDISVRRAFRGRLCRAKNTIDTALAKPPRNCDRFANEAEARKAFIVWYNTVYELWGDNWNEVSSCDLKHNVDDILQDYIKWLFSPAEDTKGESDASK